MVKVNTVLLLNRLRLETHTFIKRSTVKYIENKLSSSRSWNIIT